MNVLFVDSGNKLLPAPFVESQKNSLIRNGISIESFKINGKGKSVHWRLKS